MLRAPGVTLATDAATSDARSVRPWMMRGRVRRAIDSARAKSAEVSRTFVVRACDLLRRAGWYAMPSSASFAITARTCSSETPLGSCATTSKDQPCRARPRRYGNTCDCASGSLMPVCAR